ncbi:hypothetical protein GCM10009834_39910 [Streptomonospora arabica]
MTLYAMEFGIADGRRGAARARRRRALSRADRRPGTTTGAAQSSEPCAVARAPQDSA